jgi:hypothetical protein
LNSNSNIKYVIDKRFPKYEYAAFINEPSHDIPSEKFSILEAI